MTPRSFVHLRDSSTYNIDLLDCRCKCVDTIAVLAIALEDMLRQLRLIDRNDPAGTEVPKRIIELARRGERDPIRTKLSGHSDRLPIAVRQGSLPAIGLTLLSILVVAIAVGCYFSQTARTVISWPHRIIRGAHLHHGRA
jgi:hypothetical protein